jgi:hypothetical protein
MFLALATRVTVCGLYLFPSAPLRALMTAGRVSVED